MGSLEAADGLVLRFAGCYLSVMLASIFVGLTPEANLIWVANGVFLSYLLLRPASDGPLTSVPVTSPSSLGNDCWPSRHRERSVFDLS